MRPARPNFLIVMTDQQRADTALAAHPVPLPHLRRFAAQGLQFTNAFCPSPHCCPSRASFFTGLSPSRHGVWNNVLNGQALSRGPKPGVRLFSEDLAEAGNALHFAGKWHVSADERPSARGWRDGDSANCLPGVTHGRPFADLRKLPTSAETRAPATLRRPGWGDVPVFGASETHNAPDENTCADAEAAIRELGGKGNPWCVYAGFLGPHDPYFVPQRWLDRVPEEVVALPPSYSDTSRDKPAIYQRLREQVFGQLSAAEMRALIRHYWAYSLYLDDLFGRLLAALEATGQAENTVVLFCSDHGDYLGDHGLLCKGIAAFDSAYRVPAVMRWPAGLKQPGRTCEDLVSLMDFAPTLLELAGFAAPKARFSGRSLAPILRGENPATWRDALFFQCNGVELYYSQRVVRTRDWKYVFNGFDFDELYDLRADPHELRNLARDPAHAAIMEQMCRRLWDFAEAEDDTMNNDYWTVALAPHGPGRI